MKPRLIQTLIETIGLAAWLALALSGQALLGAGILLVALTLEHVVAFNGANGRSLLRTSGVFPGALVSGLIETGLWVVWLLISNPLLAFLFLASTLVFAHSRELNVFLGRSEFSPSTCDDPLGQLNSTHLPEPIFAGRSDLPNSQERRLGSVRLAQIGV